MKTHRWMGFALLLSAGCASTPVKKPMAISAAHTAKPTPAPLVEPDWQAPSTPTASELLAQNAAEYAKTLQPARPSPDTLDPPAVRAGTPAPRASGLTRLPEVPVETAPTALATSAPPQAQPASSLLSPQARGIGSDPQILPESADFQSPTGGSAHSDDLGDRLRRRLAQNPHDIADQLDLQLYGMLNEDPTAELAAVSSLPDDDREVIAALIDGLSNFRSTVRQDSNLLAAQKIKPLIEMADRLRSQADLCVSTVQLCSRVDAYGKYTPISPARFPAGRDNGVIVYCEVENFLTKQNSQQMWQTKLTEQVTIYTDTGMLAWSGDVQPVTDECRNRRRDFFAYNVITLPKHLTLGRYLLKVSIEDKNADRVAEASVPFEITADTAN